MGRRYDRLLDTVWSAFGRLQNFLSYPGTAIALLAIVMQTTVATAQTLPDNEVQVHMDGYFDNFGVNVIYPSISLTKQVASSTSVSGRYLVDVVTAASIKNSASDRQSENSVDAVTSASQRGEGVFSNVDDVRQQVGFGVTQLLSKITLTVNGLYSAERDYTSKTIAGSVALPFAKNNTIFNLGFVRSWDRVFPVTVPWKRSAGVTTWSGGLTQILGKGAVLQLNGSYTRNRGFLSDAYNTVSVQTPNGTLSLDPVHPGSRERKAAGIRSRFSIAENVSLDLGYRYYQDDWSVDSHTASAYLERRLRSGVRLRTGLRVYSQSRAFFFRGKYTSVEPYMTVDSKLDRGRSAEFELEAVLGRQAIRNSEFLSQIFSDQTELTARFDLYIRHTDTPNWFSGSRNLVASIVSLGYRYRF